MKVAYIAGPFRSATHWGIVNNVRQAEEVALRFWKKGYAVICPHLNTANFQGAVEDDQVWLDGDIEMMKRCDTVVMIEGWEKSSGARAEHEIALAEGKEVLYDCE